MARAITDHGRTKDTPKVEESPGQVAKAVENTGKVPKVAKVKEKVAVRKAVKVKVPKDMETKVRLAAKATVAKVARENHLLELAIFAVKWVTWPETANPATCVSTSMMLEVNGLTSGTSTMDVT